MVLILEYGIFSVYFTEEKFFMKRKIPTGQIGFLNLFLLLFLPSFLGSGLFLFFVDFFVCFVRLFFSHIGMHFGKKYNSFRTYWVFFFFSTDYCLFQQRLLLILSIQKLILFFVLSFVFFRLHSFFHSFFHSLI